MFISLRKKFKLRLILEGAIVGITTGIVIASFRYLIDEADIYRPICFEALKLNFNLPTLFLAVIIMLLTAYLTAKSIQLDKQVAGSGVPQIEGILQNKMHMIRPFRLLVVKFIASVSCISAGMSLGRAGLSVQFGACIGIIFNRILGHENKHNTKNETVESRHLLTAGAGAGLAAIFNAPLTGVIFCVEELQKKFTSELLLVSMTAAVSASAVVEFVFGIRPVFETITPTVKTVPLISTAITLDMIYSMTAIKFFVSLLILGTIIGILGALFTKMLIVSLDVYDKIGLKDTKRFAIPLLSVIVIGMILPQILGCGNVLVDELLSSNFSLQLLIILFTGKFLFTMLCFGTNAPGGIFLPLLVLGALSGNIFVNIGIHYGFFTTDWITMFIIFGMAAYFAAVVKAPITGSVLIMELTGNFSHLLALIIVSGVAYLISDLFGSKPAYQALLERSLKFKSEVKQ